MTKTEQLRSLTLKDLAQMARKRGVTGWHSMRKEQLVKALARVASKESAARSKSTVSIRSKTAPRPASKGVSVRAGGGLKKRTSTSNALRDKKTAGAKKTDTRTGNRTGVARGNGKVSRRIAAVRKRLMQSKDLAFRTPTAAAKDRLVVMVRDPFWLQAYWELSRRSVERAQAALGQDWHSARPVLRLTDVANNGTTSAAERTLRYIEIHGGVSNWYIDVQDPPATYRVDIGYLTAGERFYLLARSNVVTTPRAGSSDQIDHNWSDITANFAKIYAMSAPPAGTEPSKELKELFEERLRRPMGSHLTARYGPGANGLLGRRRGHTFDFDLDAELIIYGATEPDAHVTLKGEPVHIRPDGTFTVRFALPNCRQVLPVVASSGDGLEQRTIVLAVERNTKVMEPVIRDSTV